MQGHRTIFLFGEAERGRLCTPLHLCSLPEVVDSLGNPPEKSLGIPYAIQTILYERELIFYRVKEEGFSADDYFHGLRLLEKESKQFELTAICMPGVGNKEIIEASASICALYNSLLILREEDLYDYLTDA